MDYIWRDIHIYSYTDVSEAVQLSDYARICQKFKLENTPLAIYGQELIGNEFLQELDLKEAKLTNIFKFESLGKVKILKYMQKEKEDDIFEDKCLKNIEELETNCIDLFFRTLKLSKKIKMITVFDFEDSDLPKMSKALKSRSLPIKELKVHRKGGYICIR